MSHQNTPGYIKISKQYRIFRQDVYSIWESYNLVDFYSQILREEISNGMKPLLKSRHLKSNSTKSYDKNNTLNLLDNYYQHEAPKRFLIESVALFEDFVGDLVHLVYKDYPGKLLGEEQEDSLKYRNKILKTIIRSEDREEILDKVIEEKIRSLFYGKVSDIFLKDSAKLEFGNFFSENKKAILGLEEIIARRNIIVHNGGKVDRKYLREVKQSEFTLNQSVQVSPDYLRNSIALLESLGATASFQVIQNVYRREFGDVSKKMQQSYTFFEKNFFS